MKTPIKILFFSAILVFCAGFAPTANLASEKPLYAMPEILEIKASPGQKVLKKITVVNQGNMPVRMKVSGKAFKTNADGKVEFITDENATKWIIPEFLELSLAKSQTKQMGVIISVPENAASGGYQQAVVFEAASDKQVGPSVPFGVLVLINVNQEKVPAASVKDIDGPVLLNSFPATLTITAANPENFNSKLKAAITVADWRGNTVASGQSDGLYVYPNSNRDFQWQFSKDNPVGIYKAQVTAQAGDKTTTKKTWFIVFPWITSLYIILITAGAALIARYAHLWRNRIPVKVRSSK